MGEVYRAHDSKLGRDVAIKTLPHEFARDPDRLARFRREARTLASLNHPNIAAIYGLEESGDVDCLVMELIPGETLRERIARDGPPPVEEALSICCQIADALEAAHEKGIIHRDLKPANVKVTPQGKVKVLDFGLAKAIWGEEGDQDLSQRATVTGIETLAGHIVGTPGYMSPEQARGVAVDKRTDIWAFGCLLYELLTGKRAFQGETQSETIAAVLSASRTGRLCPRKPPRKSANCCASVCGRMPTAGWTTSQTREKRSRKHNADGTSGVSPPLRPRDWAMELPSALFYGYAVRRAPDGPIAMGPANEVPRLSESVSAFTGWPDAHVYSWSRDFRWLRPDLYRCFLMANRCKCRANLCSGRIVGRPEVIRFISYAAAGGNGDFLFRPVALPLFLHCLLRYLTDERFLHFQLEAGPSFRSNTRPGRSK